MTVQYPGGSIQGLCSAGATCFSVSVAFLGVWAFQSAGMWRTADLAVLVPLLLGCIAFGATPYLATSPAEAPEKRARQCFLLGAALLVCAVALAALIAFTG